MNLTEIFDLNPFALLRLFEAFWMPVLILLGACFLIARNDEKHSGKPAFPGKSVVAFTLMNKGAWVGFLGMCTMLVAFVLDDTVWSVVRIGLILCCTGFGASFWVGKWWMKWSGTYEPIPSKNIYVKCYTGINVFLLSVTVLALVSILTIVLVEAAMFGDDFRWSYVEIPFKIALVILIASGIFLKANLSIFSEGCYDIASAEKDTPPKED